LEYLQVAKNEKIPKRIYNANFDDECLSRMRAYTKPEPYVFFEKYHLAGWLRVESKCFIGALIDAPQGEVSKFKEFTPYNPDIKTELDKIIIELKTLYTFDVNKIESIFLKNPEQINVLYSLSTEYDLITSMFNSRELKIDTMEDNELNPINTIIVRIKVSYPPSEAAKKRKEFYRIWVKEISPDIRKHISFLFIYNQK